MSEDGNRTLGRYPGGCACGGVRFVARGALDTVGACHCQTCRRWSGYFWGSVLHDREAIEWESDATLSWWQSSAGARRGFCVRCGSSLFFDAAYETRLEIAAGAFDGPISRATTTHIFCAEAGDYYRIPADAACYASDEPA